MKTSSLSDVENYRERVLNTGDLKSERKQKHDLLFLEKSSVTREEIICIPPLTFLTAASDSDGKGEIREGEEYKKAKEWG